MAGLRHMLEQFGPALELPWTKLKAPPLTETLIDRMVEGTRAQAAVRHQAKRGSLARRPEAAEAVIRADDGSQEAHDPGQKRLRGCQVFRILPQSGIAAPVAFAAVAQASARSGEASSTEARRTKTNVPMIAVNAR